MATASRRTRPSYRRAMSMRARLDSSNRGTGMRARLWRTLASRRSSPAEGTRMSSSTSRRRRVGRPTRSTAIAAACATRDVEPTSTIAAIERRATDCEVADAGARAVAIWQVGPDRGDRGDRRHQILLGARARPRAARLPRPGLLRRDAPGTAPHEIRDRRLLADPACAGRWRASAWRCSRIRPRSPRT